MAYGIVYKVLFEAGLIQFPAARLHCGRQAAADPLSNYITSDSCWLWQGGKSQGYGKHAILGYVHRATYERKYGPIPGGYILHHTCEVRRCINPDHTVPITRAEHIKLHEKLRMVA